MGKLLTGLGLCFVLGSLQPALAQDPFSVQTYERSSDSQPIISTLPLAQRDRPYNQRPLTSRPKNAQVRSNQTPAQQYIHKKAVFEAQQRTLRMEQRKWRGESLLRPSNPTDRFIDYELPVWYTAYNK